jgi:WhiB family transcriptional regulator, redox-sensing transcriptional regulator
VARAHWGARPGSGSVMNHEASERARAVLARAISVGPDLTGALCTQTDPEVWFPEQGEGSKSQLARKLCQQCPVRDLCLDRTLNTADALTHTGVWAGYTAVKIRRMRNLRAALRRACAPPKQGVTSATPPTEGVHRGQAA